MIRIFTRKYSKTLIDYFETPKNIGSLDKKLKNVRNGIVGAPACGDVMKLQIQVDNNIIKKLYLKLLVVVQL
jgi:nitrogen fixation NifU-like protein